MNSVQENDNWHAGWYRMGDLMADIILQGNEKNS